MTDVIDKKVLGPNWFECVDEAKLADDIDEEPLGPDSNVVCDRRGLILVQTGRGARASVRFFVMDWQTVFPLILIIFLLNFVFFRNDVNGRPFLLENILI